MIQGILSFEFLLNQKETGEIEPEFRPIELVFSDNQFTVENYGELIDVNDLFAVFYTHTTGIYELSAGYSNFYTGKLKETPYQIISYYKQVKGGYHFITITCFELDDEIELYNNLIEDLAPRLDENLEKIRQAENTRKLNLIDNLHIRLRNELKYTIFQIERLSNLTKLQKAALIYNSIERIKVLEELREFPVSKKQLKLVVNKLNPSANIDVILQPLLELNLIRRDWIVSKDDKASEDLKNQGEYLFLAKDMILSRVPNKHIIKEFEEKNSELASKYKKNVKDFFRDYNPLSQSFEDTKKLTNILLNPDTYDFFILLKTNYYPLDKIPKIFSEFAVTENLIKDLKELRVITELTDKKDRHWIVLLTDIKPLIVFPEYILPKIMIAFKSKKDKSNLDYRIAKRAYELLELTYPEEISF